MTDSLLRISPSLVSRIIVKSRQLKSEAEVLNVYNQISNLDSGELTEKDIDDAFPDETDIKDLLSEHIPDTLKPFADALLGAISNEAEKHKEV